MGKPDSSSLLDSRVIGTLLPLGGLGFCNMLGILFIALRLLHKIGWSWWWVLSPIWITAAYWAFLLAAVFVLITRKRPEGNDIPRRLPSVSTSPRHRPLTDPWSKP